MPSALNLCADDVKTTDEHDAYVIANAVSWTVFQARGRERMKGVAQTREEARSAARLLLAERPDRPVLIYAVTRLGRQAVAETVRA